MSNSFRTYDLDLKYSCSIASIHPNNPRYVYFFVDRQLKQIERWNMFGKLSSAYKILEYPAEMKSPVISFIDTTNNLLFFISELGVIKVVNIDQYLDTRVLWISSIMVLIIMALTIVVVVMCCICMTRKVRKQRRKEDELVELLTESIQTYGASENHSTETWIIPSDDLKIRKVIAAGSFGTVFRGFYKNTEVAIKVITEKL
jgi:hypothetical protein